VSGNDLSKVAPIRGGKHIQSFVARSAGVQLSAFSSRTFLQNLRALDLSQNPISDISVLVHAYLLKGLWLADCQLNSYGQALKVIKKMKYLEVLDLRYALRLF
jgi:hypothetical protein